MKIIKVNHPRFLVLKREDIEKYLTDKQKDNLEDITCDVHTGRMAEGKSKWPNTYLVFNIDEPYAQQVWDIMHSHGHTPCSDCHESKKEMFCKPGSCLWHRLYTNKEPYAHVYCQEQGCGYSTDPMPYSELILKLSEEGGYITSDTEGGYYSKCPVCEGENLSLERD